MLVVLVSQDRVYFCMDNVGGKRRRKYVKKLEYVFLEQNSDQFKLTST